MRPGTPVVLLTCTILFGFALLLGCGGNAGPAPTAPAAGPAAGSGSGGSGSGGSGGGGSPTGGSCSGGSGGSSGGSSSGSMQWSSSVDNASGTVTVSTTGDVTLQVTGAKASTTFDGYFCQYPSEYYAHHGQNACFALNQSLVTDASGNGKLTFHFPKPGSWSGNFNVTPYTSSVSSCATRQT